MQGVTTSPSDPKWPRLLGLAVHELRAPMTVVAGYIRMLLKDPAGGLTDHQRRLLGEAEKSCGRLSALLLEMSDLANLEAATATFNRGQVDVHALLADAITALPQVPDREVQVRLAPAAGSSSAQGDPVRLKTAFTSLLTALGRELVTSTELFVRQRAGEYEGRPATWIAMGDAEHIDALEHATPASLAVFDEWRGGCGLSLAVARRVLDGHGGAMWSPGDGSRAGAVMVIPQGG